MATRLAICLGLVAATAGVYGQVGGFEFLLLDDDGYVASNAHVRAGVTLAGVRWAFATTAMGNWHPLTWLSLMLDAELYGIRPAAFHLVNAGIHALNGVLLFLLFSRFTGAVWRSAFVAAVFCLHPLHVESVAWVSERKDVLFGFFWLASTFVYGIWATRRSRTAYAASLFLMALGVMAKPAAVTLPFALLLFDYWPLRRRGLGALLLEKLPFLALSLASSVAAVAAQTAPGVFSLPLLERVQHSVVSYVRYLGKALWPVDLAVLYPDPVAVPLLTLVGALLVLAAISAFAIRFARQAPHALTGWLFFVGVLFPMIGVVQIGDQPTLPPDRYMYLPLVGLSWALAWNAGRLAGDRVLALAGAALLVALGVASHAYVGVWRDSATLFEHVHATQAPTPTPIVQRLYGTALMQQGRTDEAIEQLEASIRGEPGDWKAHAWLAEGYEGRGALDAAIRAYRRAVELNPSHTRSWNRLGRSLVNRGDLASARAVFDRTIAADPDDPEAWESRGIVAEFEGDAPGALHYYREALRRQPALSYSRARLSVLEGEAAP